MNKREVFVAYCRNESFKGIATLKGTVAPIAEKSWRNFDLKSRNPVNVRQRIHHFAVGHTFKQLDTEKIFGVMLNERSKKKEATQLLALQEGNFTFWEKLKKVVESIRHVNSHFVHDFTPLALDAVGAEVVTFIRESFELAVVQTYLSLREKTSQQRNDNPYTERDLVNFLCQCFYSLNDEAKGKDVDEDSALGNYKQARATFSELTFAEAIDSLLFVEATEEFEWKLFDNHRLFMVAQGRYLSFHACLFLLSMFLYKSEANQLISKVKGFKRTDDDEFRSKRNLFTFFAKRFSSQDVNSEEVSLVRFRDLVQYLNHYPTCWNGEMELEPQHPEMVDPLREAVIRMEIARSYPINGGNERFVTYVKYQIWGERMLGKHIKKEYMHCSFTQDEIDCFNYEIETPAVLIGERKKLKELNEANCPDFSAIKKVDDGIKKLEKKGGLNPTTVKLKARIAQNTLTASYGRNQDRFMEMATRYLAEQRYFGADAKFRMYQFYASQEQNEELDRLKEPHTKKEYDQQKFHQGQLVHFDSYAAHLERYPEWDVPFVVSDNAIQVQIEISDSICFKVVVQRSLMVYLLDHALQCDRVEGAGKVLLTDYHHAQRTEQAAGLGKLSQTSEISAADKRELKKLLPKRLLHGYSPPVSSGVAPCSTLSLILSNAEDREKRYEALKNQAEDNGRLVEFCNRNKGKQHQLQFVRRAWNLMYFRQAYLQQVEASGEHHKRYHITKDEFNDFCRYMYAFDELPRYKDYLRELLDGKGFLENEEFRTLFEAAGSLGDLYHNTKRSYTRWLSQNDTPVARDGRYHLEGYKGMLGGEMFFVNLSHFTTYMEGRGLVRRGANGEILHRVLGNVQHLIPAYYYKDKLEPKEYRSCGKLYNQLKHAKLEDALLYEMALRYLHSSQTIRQNAATGVAEMLTQDVVFDIADALGKHLYQLVIPFKKIDVYAELMSHKTEQEDSKHRTSFLSNIVNYIGKVASHKDIKDVAQHLRERRLTLDDLNKVESHIMTSSIRFTSLNMALEEYFVYSEKLEVKKENRICFDDINGLKPYYTSRARSKAFHFGVPDSSYEDICRGVEAAFVNNEVRPACAASYGLLSLPIRNVCFVLLKGNHGNFFNWKERDGRKKIADAKQRFFTEVVAGTISGSPKKIRSITLER